MEAVNHYSETDLGNVSPNPRGEYDPKESYEYLDLVSYQGGSYLCLAELETTITGTAPDPGRNTEFWQLLTLPGNLTAEAVAMHDDVVNKAAQVEISRAAVEQAQQEVEASQADVQQLHEDTVQAAQEAENSRDSAAGYAQSAEASRKAAAESEQNINAQMTGLDQKVSESVTKATGDITAARQKAIDTITTQEDTSTEAVKQVGNAALESARQALRDINTAGQQAVQAVTDQQNTSVQAIKDETNSYIEEKKQEISDKTDEVTQTVNQAGEEQLQNIANSLDKNLTESGKAADSKAVGDAITQLSVIESSSGSEIVLDDSAEMPLKGLHIYGKSTQTTTTGAQLLKYPYANNDDNYGFPGIIVKTCDGHVKMTGITTEGGNFYLMRNVPPGAYGLKVSNSFKGANLLAYDYVNKKIVAQISANTGLKQTLTVTEEANVGIYFNTSNAGVTVDADVDILLTKAENIDTAPFEPYSAGYPSPSPDFTQEIKSVGNTGDIEIKIRGKNLFDIDTFVESRGATYSKNADGYIVTNLGKTFGEPLQFNKNDTKVVLSGKVTDIGTKMARVSLLNADKKMISSLYATDTAAKAEASFVRFDWSNNNNESGFSAKNLQIETDDTPTVYEPYHIPQVLTIQIPSGLLGIPVDSGGNYTDSDGQQWICDEVDFERDVYIQRVSKKIIDSKAIIRTTNSKPWLFFIDTKDSVNANVDGWIKMIKSNYFTKNVGAWSSEATGILGNDTDIILSMPGYTVDTLKEWLDAKEAEGKPLEVYYLLSNPIETPLTEEQIASYKALHTYNGTTIIESEADLSLSYVANPKKYIDKKFAELSQAIIASASEAE